jgi:hypothetical protein
MNPISIPKPVPGFQTQTLDGEIVLLHPTNNTILHINQTGAVAVIMAAGAGRPTRWARPTHRVSKAVLERSF